MGPMLAPWTLLSGNVLWNVIVVAKDSWIPPAMAAGALQIHAYFNENDLDKHLEKPMKNDTR